ncbi:MAG: hypothetical protein HOL45_05060 [Chloroflexi bacterium]|jgi:hypothetical protein|nr:hypothetical protein [Chloroflexota bacterium]
MGQGTQWTIYKDPTQDDDGYSVGTPPEEFINPESANWRKVMLYVILGAIAVFGVVQWGPALFYSSWPTADPPEPYSPPQVVRAELDRIMNAAADISGLDPVDDYRVEFIDRTSIAELARELPDDPDELAEFEEDLSSLEDLLKLLGLAPQNFDLLEEFGLAGTSVIGLYDPETEIIYVATEGPDFTVTAELTLVHEFVHRLQDAQYDLEVLDEEAAPDTEAEAALQALVEGHADFVETTYYWDVLTEEQRNDYIDSFNDINYFGFRDTPDVFGRMTLWPYDAGEKFVENVTISGFDAHRIYVSPPETTEQIIGRYKYEENDLAYGGPIPEGLNRTVGDGWTISDEGVLGAGFITNWLASIISNDELAADGSLAWAQDIGALNRVVTDWARDDYLVLEQTNGEQGLAVVIQWDERSDVGEFQTQVTSRYRRSSQYELLETSESSFELWTGPQGVVGFVDVRERPEATFMAVASTVWQVDQFLQLMTSGDVSTVDAGRSGRLSPLPKADPVVNPDATSTPSPTSTSIPLPTPTTVPWLLPVRITAPIDDVLIRLGLLGMISPDDSDELASSIARENRPLAPLVRPIRFPSDLLSRLGDDWSVRTSDAAGLGFIERWLQALGSDQGDHDIFARQAARGWSGDGFQILDGPTSQVAMVWRIDWNDPDLDVADPGAIRHRDQEVDEFSAVLHRTLDQSPDFVRLESTIPDQTLWQGPAGVLGFRNDNVLGWTSIAVFQDVSSANLALQILRFL